ncbi:MAG: cytochrome C [Alphaproteobacteria bacterium]|uniref:Cytochrome C n=1 Tax=Candidatus Nitrobium versatile TaxID=2884831 RepID=A0A953SEU6_9BACT|nr:cytochrome C [Candidatus Nitrobium versatile]
MGEVSRGGRLVVLAGFLFLFVVSVYFPLPRGAKAAQGAESCVTDKCHSKMGKDTFVHGPAAVGQCEVCHISQGKHVFAPIKNAGELCYKCHERVDTMKGVHKPVKEGNCTQCHDPHQSSLRYMLRGEGPDLCFRCHDKKIAGGSFVHGPVAVGGCSMCHNPHQTDYPRMLNAVGNEVCFQCHLDKAEEFKGKKFAHKPAAEKCTACHNPHSGDYKFNFRKEGSQELCFECHKDKKEWVERVKVKHGGLETGKKCLACHDPHVSDYGKQLVQQPIDTCVLCHDKPLDAPGGKIMNMKEHLAKNKDHHGPIKQNDCSACHNTHGSDHFRILRKNFAPVFYASFDTRNFELCFNCHEKNLVLDSKTTTMTGFRNGDQNLHFVHVNKAIKGRTCRACHDAHATNNPKHIRDAVPFGSWGLPVGFQKSANGGSCLPGCHQKFVYDRSAPVKNR